MICLKTYKNLGVKDFDTIEDWCAFVNSNRDDSHDLIDYIGECHYTDLPSTHKIWKARIALDVSDTLDRHRDNLSKIMSSKDSNTIKYLYNSTTDVQDINKIIERLGNKLADITKDIKND